MTPKEYADLLNEPTRFCDRCGGSLNYSAHHMGGVRRRPCYGRTQDAQGNRGPCIRWEGDEPMPGFVYESEIVKEDNG